jgi:hypothetical protein
MPFVNGAWLHHNNCIWCVFRTPCEHIIKKGQKPRVFHFCNVHQKFVDPYLTDNRICLEYTQIDCGCEPCMTRKVGKDTEKSQAVPGYLLLQLANRVDK